MLSKYHKDAIEVSNRIQLLHKRKGRFSKHPTLHTRVEGVCLEISDLEKQLAVLKATAKWADELNSTQHKQGFTI